MALIGNDIVDLGLPGALEKAEDRRFADRVFSPPERRQILRAPCPSTELWALWTAKEACFKVVQKLEPEVVFSHRAFEVCSVENARLQGWVRFRDRRFLVRWDLEPDYVHCTCQDTPEWRDCTVAVSEIPDGVSESQAVRELARVLLEEHGIAEARIVRPPQFNRAGPPIAVVDGHAVADVDLTLSHDGRYAAAGVILGEPRRPGRPC